MISNKKVVQRLIEIFSQKGIYQVVVSPGSRNAPLIKTFAGKGGFQLYSVPDERTAGFIALGMAMKTRRPVILSCTSGSALLHYGPAIVEAYYQNIPLVILSADRPVHFIDQGHGQSIRQDNVFQNYIKAFLSIDESSVSEPWYFDSKINEVLSWTTGEGEGPVHINLHLDEPLYEFEEARTVPVRMIRFPVLEKSIMPDTLTRLQNIWRNSDRIMIIVGQHPPRHLLNSWLDHMATGKKVVILTEHTSNVSGGFFKINHIDRCIFPLSRQEWEAYKPDLLITFGKEIVSKKIKKLLLQSKGFDHWHVGKNADPRDTFGALTEVIRMPPHRFLEAICAFEKKAPEYQDLWESRAGEAHKLHAQFMSQATWSDLKAWDDLVHRLPGSLILHLGNSASIRYSLLFDLPASTEYYSNRGVSGIDGCVSTALGFALQEKEKSVWLICGDITFLYDRNAFWQTPMPENFKIIVINNGGGGIFRFIEGPLHSGVSDPYLETPHTESVLTSISNPDIHKFSAHNSNELQEIFPNFAAASGVAILEIRTPREINDLILRDYFENLKSKT